MFDAHDECIQGGYTRLFSSDLLRGKTALITGGGSGIGFTIAEIFLRHGCNVAIASRNKDRVEGAAVKLQAATGGNCIGLQMDVRKPEEISSAVEKTLAHFKAIPILVNNAAGNFLCPLSAMSPGAYKTVLDIDARGTFNTSKIIFDKYMKDHGGVIINISATLRYRGQALQAHAGSAKAAVDALTKHMAVEWGQYDIRVVGVAPGPIMNTVGMNKLGTGQQHSIAKCILLGRLGSRLEIAHATLFLASSAASYITGTTLVADGGTWLGAPDSYNYITSTSTAQSFPSKL